MSLIVYLILPSFSSLVPRGMMNQGPKFNAPMHGGPQHQQQPSHHNHGPQQTPVTPDNTLKNAIPTSVSTAATPVVPLTSTANKIEDVGTPTEDEKKTSARDLITGTLDDPLQEGDNLSEFSDDGDEILVKNDEELRLEQEELLKQQQLTTTTTTTAEEGQTVDNALPETGEEEEVKKDLPIDHQSLDDQDDLTLDFEEISDGELEEDSAKVKGLGDALGVDWAGLVAAVEPRDPGKSAGEGQGDLKTSVKEMWAPKRIFRDVGISVRMAGMELAKRLLGGGDLVEEKVGGMRIKNEPLDEEEEGQQLNGDGQPKEEQLEVKSADQEDLKEITEVDLVANPIASCQVSLRRKMQWRSNLIVNRNSAAGGVNPVALCARRDLQIRRQLCGLPAGEIQLRKDRNDEQQQQELKALAMECFAKATAVY